MMLPELIRIEEEEEEEEEPQRKWEVGEQQQQENYGEFEVQGLMIYT